LSELKANMANPNNIIRPSVFSLNKRPVPSERPDLPEHDCRTVDSLNWTNGGLSFTWTDKTNE